MMFGLLVDRLASSLRRRRWYKLVRNSGLFDSTFYSEQLDGQIPSFSSPLQHYVSVGIYEDRWPSADFDPCLYRSLYPDVAASAELPLIHYIRRGHAEGRLRPDNQARFAVELMELGLFDPQYYARHHPEAASNGLRSIDYFMRHGLSAGHAGSASFDPISYLTMYWDVRTSGIPALVHYVEHGRHEGRESPPVFDARSSRNALVDDPRWRSLEVRWALLEAEDYFRDFGFTFDPSGPTDRVAEAAAALAASVPALSIPQERPEVSIILPVYGQTPFVLGCFHALAKHASRFSVEIIVADDVSPAEARMDVLQSIPWIRYERNTENLGFLDNCNEAVKRAKGRYAVLLNSDTWVMDRWLDELIGSFELFPKAGYVGSKLLNGDGTLQEAGCVYWRDGTAWNYGRNGDPEDPRYNFARQVDWVSGAAIAVPRDLWTKVGGFDTAYRPAYCEDVDLAFRLRELGHEVWYQPLSRVIHFEGMTHGRDETSGIKSYQVANLRLLRERWAGKLPGVRDAGAEPDREACRSATKVMLIVDATVHRSDRDAGSVLASEIMRAYRDLGYHQIFVPLDFSYDARYAAEYQRLGVEVLRGPYFGTIEAVLRERPHIDCALLFRYNIAREVIDPIRKAVPAARIVFSNVDLHFLRMKREALLHDDPQMALDAASVKTKELQVFATVDCSLVHTQVEKDTVQSCLPTPVDNILVLPWIAHPIQSDANREARRHIMFLGGFPHAPNGDAVRFFVHEVWPLLIGRLPDDAKFLVVGNAPPEDIRSLASDRIEVTGHVPKVEPYFATARVFVAPLRYGAGIKGKVIQSLSNGVPTVATGVAAEGIGLVDEEHYLLADTPDAIAEAILRLFAEPDTWQRMHKAGLDFVERSFSADAARSLYARSLDVANETWLSREAARGTRASATVSE